MDADRTDVARPGLALLGYPYTPDPGTARGIDHYLYYLAAGYRRLGLSFRVVEAGRYVDGVRQVLWGEPRILSRVARCRARHWHAVSPVGARVAVLLGRRPLLTTVHDVMPFFLLSRHPARYRFLRFCIRLAARRSDALIVTFPSVRQYLIDELRVPEERIHLVPVGVDPTILGSGGEMPGPSASDRLLFLGSRNPIDRGGDIAIRAMHTVARQFPAARLIVSCEGPERAVLERLARELGLGASVEFRGFVPEEALGATLRSVAALVAPSRLGYTISVMHAMYSGVPVVVSDVRDQAYFVGPDGLVVPPEDPNALGRALVDLLADASLRERYARGGWTRVRQFSAERMVRDTLSVYALLGWSPSAG